MPALRRTALYDRHLALGARMVGFGGWEMPLLYPTGIVAEHLATRKTAGLFDVSHMGRLVFRGEGALAFLQHALSNNAAALDAGQAQYTLLPTATGGAVDDAYLYCFVPDEYLLVVNAANREKDLAHFASLGAQCDDRTDDLAMLALQGPQSRAILLEVIEAGGLPEPRRNALSAATIAGAPAMIARTGYTGEPLCFELFVPTAHAPALWDLLIARGAAPVGLGARDTLRLEAGLPLYGHELGDDPDGNEIPIYAVAAARGAVSFVADKGDFIGREALAWQEEAYREQVLPRRGRPAELPRLVQSLAVVEQAVARAGARVFRGEQHVGFVTSGTMVPYWVFAGEGLESRPGDEHALRSIALALLDSDVAGGDSVSIDVRGRRAEAVVVPYHLRSDAPPYARPIIHCPLRPSAAAGAEDYPRRARRLLEGALANTEWRQRECINLIPSEMTASPMARLLSVMDPAFRYAEHRALAAFCEEEVFYYQGTAFIAEVERLLEAELRAYLGCPEVETRLISGQMANTAVYSGLVDYLNRGDRRAEPRRLARVMHHHIGRGGHLSAQPMGALRDYIARDPRTERAAVTDFPARPDNPFQVDVPATLALIEEVRPELIIFGRSMVLHPEPIAQVCRFLDEQGLDAVVMYDAAHVLGLLGPHFQEPFAEGADVVTGSTHKTFFGTQRGVIGGRWRVGEERHELWPAIRRRSFPGSVSNHHLGTLLGLLMAAYEMNHFRGEYQPRVIADAKAFARALHECGLDVAGDPAVGYTQTHQVIVRVGYARGPEIAARLEANNIICNYQAAPDEEGFTAAGALRLGVAEMTRFGMGEEDFRALAPLLADVVLQRSDVRDQVVALRRRFHDLRYCFSGDEFAEVLEGLRAML
jgi:aminomethyltransferase